MRIFFLFILLSVLLLVIGSIFLFTTGANLGVDFTGGTSITISNETITRNEIEEFIKEVIY